jgi:hypothetical protein
VVCLLCGLKHFHEQRAAPGTFKDCLHNGFQPVLLSLFINGFASQEDPNPLNCFRIQSAASTQPYIKDFYYFTLSANISLLSRIARWLNSLLLKARMDVPSTELFHRCVVTAGVFERADRPSRAPTKCLQRAKNNVGINQLLCTFDVPKFYGKSNISMCMVNHHVRKKNVRVKVELH